MSNVDLSIATEASRALENVLDRLIIIIITIIITTPSHIILGRIFNLGLTQVKTLFDSI